jgi:hypothetical protein
MTTWGLSPQAEDTDRILSIPGVVVFSGVIAFPSVLAFPSVIGFADFAEAQAAAASFKSASNENVSNSIPSCFHHDVNALQQSENRISMKPPPNVTGALVVE